MKYVLFLFILVTAVPGYAQSGRSIRVRAGEDIAQAYSVNGFYRFPQFIPATLHFKGKKGEQTGLRFNHNLLTGAMQFIGTGGDTLDLAGLSTLDSVTLGNIILHYREGFMEEVDRADSVRLLKKIILKLQFENIGAYGQSNPTASISNYNNYFAGTGVYNLSINQDVVITELKNWYWLDGQQTLLKANKTNLLRLLSPAAREEAEAFLKKQKVNFEKEADLRKLMEALRR